MALELAWGLFTVKMAGYCGPLGTPSKETDIASVAKHVLGLPQIFANPDHAGEMRRILLSTAKILISAALLYLALRKVDLTELLSRLTATSLIWIAMAIMVTFLQIFVGVLRWREISAECGAPLELGRAMRYNVIGAFFNQTLPLSLIHI